MKSRTKNITIMPVLIILVIGIILLINYIKANENQDEKTMKCIAENSILIVSRTCSACAHQKEILGKYINYFETMDVMKNPEVWQQYNLEGVPTWIINGEKYLGVRSIKQLKELTGC